MRRYTGIEIGRVIFACLIPLLHIAFYENIGVDIVRQYIARLGVPFFFAVSGMFLRKSMEQYGSIETLRRYLHRVGRILLIWLLIYFPFLIRGTESYLRLLQEILFKTPAYLWYLTGLLVASIPFCLLKNRKALYGCAAALYLVGTLFGGAYEWLVGGVPQYEAIFLTTRNGVFFGLPLMCVGELTWMAKKKSAVLLVVSGLILATEITIVGVYADRLDDRSMYFALPLFIYALVVMLREWNPSIDVRNFGGISSAIYVMQYGIITVGSVGLKTVGFGEKYALWLVYMAVIIIPVAFYRIFQNTKLVKIIF